MHLAICDDNVGDRKQLERLLKRESDKRTHTTGVLYIDSYGNVASVMQSPMLYDAFYLDVVTGDINGAMLTDKLLQAGVTAPIILCVSSIDYRAILAANQEREYPNVIFLDKPIKTDELSESIDHALSLKSRSLPTFELRGEKETRYVTEDDIVHAYASGIYVTVHLKDGCILNVLTTIDNFFAQLANCEHYYAISGTAMVNIIYVKKVSLFKLTLKDDSVLKISPAYSADLKKELP